MHMADALLSPATGGVMWAATAATVAVGSRALKRKGDNLQVPLMGVMGAFVFAAQMINFAIPGTGSSGHFAGGMLLSLLLGPHAAFLTMASVLTVQALFFADGGLLALGANIFNMGFVPAFIVYPLIYRPLAGAAPRGSMRRRVMICVGAMLALQLGALGVVVETTASGIAELPFSTFLLAMLPIHLAIGAVEGLITLAVVEFVERSEPRLFAQERVAPASGRTVGTLAVVALIVGGVLSWFASSHPDGLEWSVARLTGKPEVSGSEGATHRAAATIQERTAFLPDYGFPAGAGADRADGEGGTEVAAEPAWGTPDAGTSVSGLAGGALTLLLAGFAGFIVRRRDPARAQ